MHIRGIGIFSLSRRQGVVEVLHSITTTCQGLELTVYIDAQTAALHGDFATKVIDTTNIGTIDVVLSVGGDGNFIRACKEYYGSRIPIVGVNFGRLGFLTSVSLAEITTCIDAIRHGTMRSQQRHFLQCSVVKPPHQDRATLALNDVSIHSQNNGRMIEFVVSVDGILMCSLRADGFIVATTAGSTAYALSAGGAIIHPDVAAIELIPVAAHTLSARAVVVPADKTIDIRMSVDDCAHVACDGNVVGMLGHDSLLRVSQSHDSVTILESMENNFFASCRAKLGWHHYEQAPSVDT